MARYFRVFGHYLQYYQDRGCKSLKGVIDLHCICGCWLHADMSEEAGARKDTVINVSFSNSTVAPSVLVADSRLSSHSSIQGKTRPSHGPRALSSQPHIAGTLQLKAETSRTAQEWADLFMEYLVTNIKRWQPPKIKTRKSKKMMGKVRVGGKKDKRGSSLGSGVLGSGIDSFAEEHAEALLEGVILLPEGGDALVQDSLQVVSTPSTPPVAIPPGTASSLFQTTRPEPSSQQGPSIATSESHGTQKRSSVTQLDLTDAATMDAVQRGQYSGPKVTEDITGETRIFL